MPEISNEDLFELATLAYRRWAEEFDCLKAVKAEKDDGSKDWQEFHAVRLKSHIESEAKWKSLLTRVTSKLPKLEI